MRQRRGSGAVVRDPEEGVEPDGRIRTGARAENIHPAYRHILDDAVELCRSGLGPALHSLHIYGSVATGQAQPPTSDVDLIAVTHENVGGRLADLGQRLTLRHTATCREVAISQAMLGDLQLERPDARANRCFLRHYAVQLAGAPLPLDEEPCLASVDLAFGFNGNLRAVLADIRAGIEQAVDPADRIALARRAARKLLMSAATLLSAQAGGWSTDRERGAELIAEREPSLAEAAQLAIAVADEHQPSPGELQTMLDDLGGWLVRAYAAAAVQR